MIPSTTTRISQPLGGIAYRNMLTPGKVAPSKGAADFVIIPDPESAVESKEPVLLDVLPDPTLFLKSGLAGETGRSVGMNGMSALRTALSKPLRMVFGASYQLSSGAAGLPNALVSNDQCTALAEFVSMATIFDEFFIKKFVIMYQPGSRYSRPTTTAYPQPSRDYPLAVVSLQHASPVYATYTLACSNGELQVCNSADPFKFNWTNTEKWTDRTQTSSSTGSPIPAQGWCSTDASSAALYTGSVQIIAPTALAGDMNILLGTTVVRWEVMFRMRK